MTTVMPRRLSVEDRGEVHPEVVSFHLAAALDRDGLIEFIGGQRYSKTPGGQASDRLPHRALRAGDDLVGERLQTLEAELLHELEQPFPADCAARDLRVEIAQDRAGHSRISPASMRPAMR